MTRNENSTRLFSLLSRLMLGAGEHDGPEQIAASVLQFSRDDFHQLQDLASTHHVILRAFPRLRRAIADRKNGTNLSRWIDDAIATEQARSDQALTFLARICQTLQEAGDVIVIKSLDHWPDLGSDLDLYTNANSADVSALMRDRLNARAEDPSWGDRLANKWNFAIPGLPELVEVHVGRLGQTGEQVAITNSLVARSTILQFGSHTFRVPAVEEQIVISTLQRMYRHFYLRLCDVADIARRMNANGIDYVYLRRLAGLSGLWDGLSSYLVIVAEYAESYGGKMLPLPTEVTCAARLGTADVTFKRKFMRIPIFPQATAFYAKEWTTLLFDGQFRNALRLTLLPGLATAAALASKAVGNDKGIW